MDIILSNRGFSSLRIGLCHNYFNTCNHYKSCIEHVIYTWNHIEELAVKPFDACNSFQRSTSIMFFFGQKQEWVFI